ncbi:3'-5' exoribonuclease 1 [Tetranychus urticae]|uniref:Exonuclease domain-containing protein n=1 Tax=Tetranychus urticae TaxID=32264 RepID=T1KBY7_TETUR|nr:3'-5' exoribonuclease 1 [Tetranychus urticae]
MYQFRNPYINYDYQTDCDIICVIDFEATCDNYGGRRPPNDAIMEIIEFPAFMVDTRTRSVISTFHEYVRPIINPKLSNFCTQLTGISQHMVDQADPFPKVLERFEKNIASLLIEKNYRTFAIATDGPWDIAHFLARQCQIHGLEFPIYAKRWINLKRVYSDCYQAHPICLDNMLTTLGIRFEGKRHSGYYDALHITKLLLKMLNDGAILTVNETLSWDSVSRKCWGNMDCGYIPYSSVSAICL